MSTGAAVKRKVQIDQRLCKGCNICIHFCPKQVLVLNESGKSEVKNIEQCIGCKFCELRCPDFAIRVLEEN